MAYSAAKTWVTSVLATASDLNTYIRDNQLAFWSGKKSFNVHSTNWRPTVSNGCDPLRIIETTAGNLDLAVLDFDASADEHAQYDSFLPLAWNLGTISFQVAWTTTATDTDGVAWGLQAVARTDGDTGDVVWSTGTPVVVTDSAQSAAEDVLVTAESGAVTVGGSPADNDLIFFRLLRDVSDGADNHTEDARLVSVRIFYTQDQLNEA